MLAGLENQKYPNHSGSLPTDKQIQDGFDLLRLRQDAPLEMSDDFTKPFEKLSFLEFDDIEITTRTEV